MADLQWGRPDIFLGKYPNDTTTFEQLATAQNAWTKIPTPIENTTKILA